MRKTPRGWIQIGESRTRGVARIPLGLKPSWDSRATPQRDSPIWIQPLGVFRYNIRVIVDNMLFLTGKNCGHNCRWYCHKYTRMILWLYRSDQQYYDIYMIYFYYAVGVIEETLADPECEGVWYSRMEQSMKTISTFGEKYMYLDDYTFVFSVNKKIEWPIMMIIYFKMSLCSDFPWPNTLRINSEYLYNSV